MAEYKQDDYQCEVCKIFSNPSRLQILLALRNGPLTVSKIIEKTGLSQSVVSQHLSMLRGRRIVETTRDGAWITYSLRFPELMNAFDIMRDVAKKTR